MPTVDRETTIVTPTTNDASAGTILGVVLGLIVVAFVCYFLFFKGPRVEERNTTIYQPSPVTPSPSPTPSTPAPNVSNTTINVPRPEAVPLETPSAPSANQSESSTTPSNP